MIRPCKYIVAIVIGVLFVPAATFACACGCNVFTVGARWTMPTSTGFGSFLQYNYMDQVRNWGNWHGASTDANPDQEIRTNFYTLGFQYMADRDWGIVVEAPVWNRYFRTMADDGKIASATHTSFGDVRLMGMYTGLSEDMSTGLQFGLKLPTGAFNQSLLDRDTQIGTGTTDLLFGGYQLGQETGWGRRMDGDGTLRSCGNMRSMSVTDTGPGTASTSTAESTMTGSSTVSASCPSSSSRVHSAESTAATMPTRRTPGLRDCTFRRASR